MLISPYLPLFSSFAVITMARGLNSDLYEIYVHMYKINNKRKWTRLWNHVEHRYSRGTVEIETHLVHLLRKLDAHDLRAGGKPNMAIFTSRPLC